MSQPSPAGEGVVKYQAVHRTEELPDWAEIGDIQHWFAYARKHHLVGRDPQRYEGAAYGNISQRVVSGGFLVTGSQTGGLDRLDRRHISWVQQVDTAANRVISLGPIAPSSEAMTHDEVYRWRPEMNFVIHVHSPSIWQHAEALGLPITDPRAAYGTPQMALAVKQLLTGLSLGQSGAVSMGGHLDGVLIFGVTPQRAGERLQELVRASQAL